MGNFLRMHDILTLHTVCGLDICHSFKEKMIALFKSIKYTRLSMLYNELMFKASLDIITVVEGEGHQIEKGSKIRRFSSPPR